MPPPITTVAAYVKELGGLPFNARAKASLARLLKLLAKLPESHAEFVGDSHLRITVGGTAARSSRTSTTTTTTTA